MFSGLDQSFCAELDDSRLGSQVLNDQEEVHADNGMGGQVWTEQEELPDGIGRGACSSGQSKCKTFCDSVISGLVVT